LLRTEKKLIGISFGLGLVLWIVLVALNHCSPAQALD